MLSNILSLNINEEPGRVSRMLEHIRRRDEMLPRCDIIKNINEKKVNFAIKIKYFFLLVNIYNIYV